MKVNELKIRIGKCFDLDKWDIKYQLQFKLPGETRYNGFSLDVFNSQNEAEKAKDKHCKGTRVYKPLYKREVTKKRNYYFFKADSLRSN